MSTPNGASDSFKQRVSEIEDALVVIAHLNTDMSNMLKEHAKFIRSHEETLERVDARLDRMTERDEIMETRISALVSAVGEFIAAQSRKS